MTPPSQTLQGILRGIVETPADEGTYLALADWLEENDDPRRAELPAQLELDVAANLAAAEGLLARATQAIEAADAAARELPRRPVALPA